MTVVDATGRPLTMHVVDTSIPCANCARSPCVCKIRLAELQELRFAVMNLGKFVIYAPTPEDRPRVMAALKRLSNAMNQSTHTESNEQLS